MTTEWTQKQNTWIAKTPTRPGIWRRRDGGYFVRRRVVDPATGKMYEIARALPEADLPGAEAFLKAETERVRTGGEKGPDPSKTRFGEYSLQLLKRKVATGELKSSQSVQKWSSALARELVPYFGALFLPKLRAAHVEAWKVDVLSRPRPPRRLRNGKLSKPLPPPSATSVNTWLAVLKAIMSAATVEYEWPRDPIAAVKPLDVSDHRTYTEEQPNALAPDEARRFLASMARLYPQHLAMTVLGFATGLRPSHMRPLRRKGEAPDVNFAQGLVLVRRSQTKGEPMNKTKTARDGRLHLPESVMSVLRWHVDRLPPGEPQKSDLLFPSVTGGYRSRSCLDKPFRAVCKAIVLRKKLTPRGMRRTYQDLMRAAQVEGIVVRAISGHATSAMQEHYSTVSPTEMRAAVGRLAEAAGFGDAVKAAGVEVFPARGESLPEAERRARYTPKRYRAALPAPEAGGGRGTSGGQPEPPGTSGGHSGGHRPDGGDDDGGRSRI